MIEQQTRPKGRPSGSVFTRRLLLYEDDEGMALLAAIARRLGVSKTAAVRLLVREKAMQLGISGKDELEGT